MYPHAEWPPSDHTRWMSEAPHNLKLEPSGPSAPAPAPGRGLRAWFIGALVLLVLVLGTIDAFVIVRRNRYQAEIARLREAMSALERTRADQIVAQEHNKLRLAVALFRRQAKLEKSLHLSVSVDSSAMYLQRDGALLREMPVTVGTEKRVGIAPDTVRLAPPLGVRRVAQVLTESDIWEVPAWVYADRGLPVPGDRRVPGGLGVAAVLLDGGAIIYTQPTTGPLADSAYVLPGAVRARSEDLRAVVPNLVPGMRIYFY
jgi:hypothetical protein